MPFDPAKPANNSAISSTELRDQFNGLKSEVDTKATPGDVSNAIAGTANNPNGQLGNLDPSWQPNPSGWDPNDLTWLRDRIVELYNATAR